MIETAEQAQESAKRLVSRITEQQKDVACALEPWTRYPYTRIPPPTPDGDAIFGVPGHPIKVLLPKTLTYPAYFVTSKVSQDNVLGTTVTLLLVECQASAPEGVILSQYKLWAGHGLLPQSIPGAEAT